MPASSVLKDITNNEEKTRHAKTNAHLSAWLGEELSNNSRKRKASSICTEHSLEDDISLDDILACYATDEDERFDLDDLDFVDIPKALSAPSQKKVQKISPSHASLEQNQNMVKTFIKQQEQVYGSINKCAFVFPRTRRYASVGYVCPNVDVPWHSPFLNSPPISHFMDVVFATEDIKYQKINLEKPATYFKNAIAVITGKLVALPGDDVQDIFTKSNGFYLMSSVSVNNCSQGLYMDVSNNTNDAFTFTLLHRQIPDTPTSMSNCEILSAIDSNSECEVLFLVITRAVNAGDMLVLSSLHKHPFQVNVRGHGKKLTWFSQFQ